MAANNYHFVTRWRVEATAGEVADIIGSPLDLPRWWPAVYLEVAELERPDEQGLGGLIRLTTKGWLPYSLVWDCAVTESRYPNGLAIAVSGDFVGHGAWTFEQDGGFVNVTFDWEWRRRSRCCGAGRRRCGRCSRPITAGPWRRARRA